MQEEKDRVQKEGVQENIGRKVQFTLWYYLVKTSETVDGPVVIHAVSNSDQSLKQFTQALVKGIRSYNISEEIVTVRETKTELDDEHLLAFFQKEVEEGSLAHLYCILQGEEVVSSHSVGGPLTASFLLEKDIPIALGLPSLELSSSLLSGSSFLERLALGIVRPSYHMGFEIGWILGSWNDWGRDLWKLENISKETSKKLKRAYALAMASGALSVLMFILLMLRF